MASIALVMADTDRTPAGALSDAGQQRRTEASAIRAEILQILPEDLPETASADARWWHYCTRGEALLGLRRYGEAKAALEFIEGIGQAYEDEMAALLESQIE